MKYHISSKQFVEEGIRIKIISEERPNLSCISAEVSLEDAYIYMTK